MSKFRNIVENILRENRKEKIKAWLRATTTPEHIYHIFHLDEELEEDKDETKNSFLIATDICNKILKKIDKKEYKETALGGIIFLNIPKLKIEFIITGEKDDISFDEKDKISIFIKEINSFHKNKILVTMLMHEIARAIIKERERKKNYVKEFKEFCKHLENKTEE